MIFILERQDRGNIYFHTFHICLFKKLNAQKIQLFRQESLRWKKQRGDIERNDVCFTQDLLVEPSLRLSIRYVSQTRKHLLGKAIYSNGSVVSYGTRRKLRFRNNDGNSLMATAATELAIICRWSSTRINRIVMRRAEGIYQLRILICTSIGPARLLLHLKFYIIRHFNDNTSSIRLIEKFLTDFFNEI